MHICDSQSRGEEVAVCFLQVCHHSIILIQHILKDDRQDEIVSGRCSIGSTG